MKEKNKKSGKGGLISTIVIILLAILTNAESDEVMQFILLLIPVGIIVAMVLALRKGIKKGSGKSGGKKSVFEHVPSFSYSPSKKEKEREEKTFNATRMDRNISYNDRAAEENFLRDKEKRLKQLEVFLKNGIIEKDEYRLLKERYEKQD